MLLVGGRFDAEDLGSTVKMFRALEENQPNSPETFAMGRGRRRMVTRANYPGLGGYQ